MDWYLLVYLMLPCYFANMVPVLVRRLRWDAAVDFGLKFRGERLLGSHKTWRGIVFGTLGALVVGFLMGCVYWPFAFSWFSWSLLTGFGALFGDLVKSFFKRRVNIMPGSAWIPFDQLDFSIGALVFGSFVFFPGWLWALFIVVFSFAGHIFINHAAYYLRIRKEKW